MKKIILLLFTVCIFSKWSNAKCDKKILWTSGKEEFTNGSGEVQKAEQNKITVEISKTEIIFNHNDDPNDVMQGMIKEFSCNWTEPFKNGITVIKAELTEGHNDVQDAVVIIEGKDGQVIITLELNDKPDMKIKAYVENMKKRVDRILLLYAQTAASAGQFFCRCCRLTNKKRSTIIF